MVNQSDVSLSLVLRGRHKKSRGNFAAMDEFDCDGRRAGADVGVCERDRQINRLYVVGSNDTTAPVIEESYQRILKLMASHMNTSPYMFGHRPAASDFGLYGQLTQLAVFDPTPMQIADEIASRVVAWVGTVDDLSGHTSLDDQWNSFAQLGDSLKTFFEKLERFTFLLC